MKMTLLPPILNRLPKIPAPWKVAAWLLISGTLSASANELQAIDTSGFRSSAHHWRAIHDSGRFIQANENQPAYAEKQVAEIAANILLFQRSNGGWPKDYDMAAILTEEQKAKVAATRDREDASFDNGNLHSQVSYLAKAYSQSGNHAWKEACLRGFAFLLSAQYPNGGFPQRYPKAKGFHAHITYNDGVMIGVLNVLNDAATGAPHFAWMDEETRGQAKDAVRRGVDCILKCQIVLEGKRAGWCQQHDEFTFEPKSGRSFELASICPQETTAIVRFLMRQFSPSSDVNSAIDGAVAWLGAVTLKDTKVQRIEAPRADFQRYSAGFDLVVLSDPTAPALWARHYEIGTNKPIFASRDGVKKYAFGEIERERRTGTPWFGTWPRDLIETEYPRWKKALTPAVP